MRPQRERRRDAATLIGETVKKKPVKRPRGRPRGRGGDITYERDADRTNVGVPINNHKHILSAKFSTETTKRSIRGWKVDENGIRKKYNSDGKIFINSNSRSLRSNSITTSRRIGEGHDSKHDNNQDNDAISSNYSLRSKPDISAEEIGKESEKRKNNRKADYDTRNNITSITDHLLRSRTNSSEDDGENDNEDNATNIHNRSLRPKSYAPTKQTYGKKKDEKCRIKRVNDSNIVNNSNRSTRFSSGTSINRTRSGSIGRKNKREIDFANRTLRSKSCTEITRRGIRGEKEDEKDVREYYGTNGKSVINSNSRSLRSNSITIATAIGEGYDCKNDNNQDDNTNKKNGRNSNIHSLLSDNPTSRTKIDIDEKNNNKKDYDASKINVTDSNSCLLQSKSGMPNCKIRSQVEDGNNNREDEGASESTTYKTRNNSSPSTPGTQIKITDIEGKETNKNREHDVVNGINTTRKISRLLQLKSPTSRTKIDIEEKKYSREDYHANKSSDTNSKSCLLQIKSALPNCKIRTGKCDNNNNREDEGADESNTDKTRNSSLPSNLATPTKIIVMEGEVKNENKEDDAMNENNESNTNNVNNYSLQLKSCSSTKRIEKQNQDKEFNKIGNNNIINTLNSNDRSLRSKVDKSVTAIGKGNESGKGNKEDDNISGGSVINSNHRSLRSRSCSLTRSIRKSKESETNKRKKNCVNRSNIVIGNRSLQPKVAPSKKKNTSRIGGKDRPICISDVVPIIRTQTSLLSLTSPSQINLSEPKPKRRKGPSRKPPPSLSPKASALVLNSTVSRLPSLATSKIIKFAGHVFAPILSKRKNEESGLKKKKKKVDTKRNSITKAEWRRDTLLKLLEEVRSAVDRFGFFSSANFETPPLVGPSTTIDAIAIMIRNGTVSNVFPDLCSRLKDIAAYGGEGDDCHSDGLMRMEADAILPRAMPLLEKSAQTIKAGPPLLLVSSQLAPAPTLTLLLDEGNESNVVKKKKEEKEKNQNVEENNSVHDDHDDYDDCITKMEVKERISSHPCRQSSRREIGVTLKSIILSASSLMDETDGKTTVGPLSEQNVSPLTPKPTWGDENYKEKKKETEIDMGMEREKENVIYTGKSKCNKRGKEKEKEIEKEGKKKEKKEKEKVVEEGGGDEEGWEIEEKYEEEDEVCIKREMEMEIEKEKKEENEKEKQNFNMNMNKNQKEKEKENESELEIEKEMEVEEEIIIINMNDNESKNGKEKEKGKAKREGEKKKTVIINLDLNLNDNGNKNEKKIKVVKESEKENENKIEKETLQDKEKEKEKEKLQEKENGKSEKKEREKRKVQKKEKKMLQDKEKLQEKGKEKLNLQEEEKEKLQQKYKEKEEPQEEETEKGEGDKKAEVKACLYSNMNDNKDEIMNENEKGKEMEKEKEIENENLKEEMEQENQQGRQKNKEKKENEIKQNKMKNDDDYNSNNDDTTKRRGQTVVEKKRNAGTDNRVKTDSTFTFRADEEVKGLRERRQGLKTLDHPLQTYPLSPLEPNSSPPSTALSESLSNLEFSEGHFGVLQKRLRPDRGWEEDVSEISSIRKRSLPHRLGFEKNNESKNIDTRYDKKSYKDRQSNGNCEENFFDEVKEEIEPKTKRGKRKRDDESCSSSISDNDYSISIPGQNTIDLANVPYYNSSTVLSSCESRDEWLSMVKEMVAVCNEASRRSTLRADVHAITYEKPLSYTYMLERLEYDYPLRGYVARTKLATVDNEKIKETEVELKVVEIGMGTGLKKDRERKKVDGDVDDDYSRSNENKMQGFVVMTNFMTYRKTFRWVGGIERREGGNRGMKNRNKNDKSKRNGNRRRGCQLEFCDNYDILKEECPASLITPTDRRLYVTDTNGRLAAALHSAERKGSDPVKGILHRRIAELSFLGGLGCGGILLKKAIDDLNGSGDYDHVVLQSTKGAIRFYEKHGFVRVGAVTRLGDNEFMPEVAYRHWSEIVEGKAIEPSYMMALSLHHPKLGASSKHVPKQGLLTGGRKAVKVDNIAVGERCSEVISALRSVCTLLRPAGTMRATGNLVYRNSYQEVLVTAREFARSADDEHLIGVLDRSLEEFTALHVGESKRILREELDLPGKKCNPRVFSDRSICSKSASTILDPISTHFVRETNTAISSHLGTSEDDDVVKISVRLKYAEEQLKCGVVSPKTKIDNNDDGKRTLETYIPRSVLENIGRLDGRIMRNVRVRIVVSVKIEEVKDSIPPPTMIIIPSCPVRNRPRRERKKRKKLLQQTYSILVGRLLLLPRRDDHAVVTEATVRATTNLKSLYLQECPVRRESLPSSPFPTPTLTSPVELGDTIMLKTLAVDGSPLWVEVFVLRYCKSHEMRAFDKRAWYFNSFMVTWRDADGDTHLEGKRLDHFNRGVGRDWCKEFDWHSFPLLPIPILDTMILHSWVQYPDLEGRQLNGFISRRIGGGLGSEPTWRLSIVNVRVSLVIGKEVSVGCVGRKKGKVELCPFQSIPVMYKDLSTVGLREAINITDVKMKHVKKVLDMIDAEKLLLLNGSGRIDTQTLLSSTGNEVVNEDDRQDPSYKWAYSRLKRYRLGKTNLTSSLKNNFIQENDNSTIQLFTFPKNLKYSQKIKFSETSMHTMKNEMVLDKKTYSAKGDNDNNKNTDDNSSSLLVQL